MSGPLGPSFTYISGDPNTNLFVLKGEPIVVKSPLEIISPDGTEVTTISTANNGDSAITTAGGMFVNLGINNDMFIDYAADSPGETHGIILSRNGIVPASIKLVDSGLMRFQTTTGSVAVMSIDGTKAATITESNNGDCSISPTLGNLSFNVGENKNVFVNTDPATAGDQDGIVITRQDAAVPCSMTLPLGGELQVETFPGSISVKSSQGAPTAYLGVNPFSGVVTLANPNDGTDGDITLSCASATSSAVEIVVRPPLATSSGIAITNVNAGINKCFVNVSATGNLQLAATNNTVQVIGDGGQVQGLQVKPASEATGNGTITLLNGSTSVTPTRYTMFNSSVDGAGLNKGNLQVFGYSGVGLGTVREVLQATPQGDAIVLGDSTIVGGASVSVNGPSGISRVFDPIYNRPGGIVLISSYATTFASSTAGTTFTIPRTGRYMIEIIFNYQSATIGSPGAATGFLKYGDPAHAAQVVSGTENTATEYMLAPTVGGFNVMTLQRFFNLANNVFEPNQRYVFSNLGQSVSGGILDMSIYMVD